MELYVNPQITGFRQDVDGTIKELKIGSNKEDAWVNIAEQGASAKLDNNKTATIDVSTYTEPVEITPTSGKDGMKKATVTLSNIPSGSGAAYYWNKVYFPFSVAPATMTQSEIENQLCFYIASARVGYDATVIPLSDYLPILTGTYTSLSYEKVSDVEFNIIAVVGEEEVVVDFELVSEKSFTLWQASS